MTERPTRTDLVGLPEVRQAVEDLRAAGWQLSDDVNAIRAVMASVATPLAWSGVEILTALGESVTSLRAVGSFGHADVHLVRVGTQFEVESISAPGGLAAFFDDRHQQESAQRLEDHESDAAWELPFTWDLEARLNLEKALRHDDDLQLSVVLDPSSLVQTIRRSPSSTLAWLVPDPGIRRLCLILSDLDAEAHFGAISFMGAAASISLPRCQLPLDGEEPLSHTRDTVRPSALIPLGHRDPSEKLAEIRTTVTHAFLVAVWCPLANTCDLASGTAEFKGLMSRTLQIPSESQITPAVLEATADLYRWAYQDSGPDRLLATRQVVSLRGEPDALTGASEIRESAEMVFLGLRSEAIGEVVRSARDAHSYSLDTVRYSLRSVQEMSKAATERTLAALVAIAAVVAANSTQTLSDHVGRNLLLAVAGFLGLLAFFAGLVEGPLLSVPLSRLREDLRTGNPLLTDSQLEHAVAMPGVEAAKRRVHWLRIAVPLTYGLLALAIVLWGYPARFS